VVVDGVEGRPYDEVNIPVFDPNSLLVAYIAQEDNKRFVVLNGQEGKRYDGIVTAGVENIIFDSPNNLHYLVIKDNSVYLIEETIK
jgi:hypothetical protein